MKDNIILIKELIEYAKRNGVNKNFYNILLQELIPNVNGKPLITSNVQENAFTTAIFCPKFESIDISVNKMSEWVNINAKDISELYNINDIETLKYFLTLFATIHEIEHAKQYLIGKKLIPSPIEMLQESYKNIYDLFVNPKYLLPRPIKEIRRILSLTIYKSNENTYFLERNANIESADYLKNCALVMNNQEIYNMFNDMKNQFIKIGYKNSNIGSIEETYKHIYMHDKYQKLYKEVLISEEEKIRYGLAINETIRKKILQK